VVDIDVWLDVYRRPSRLKKLAKVTLVNFHEAEQIAKVVQATMIESMKDMGLTDEQIEEWKKEFNKGGYGVPDDNDENKAQYRCSPKEVDVESKYWTVPNSQERTWVTPYHTITTPTGLGGFYIKLKIIKRRIIKWAHGKTILCIMRNST